MQWKIWPAAPLISHAFCFAVAPRMGMEGIGMGTQGQSQGPGAAAVTATVPAQSFRVPNNFFKCSPFILHLRPKSKPDFKTIEL